MLVNVASALINAQKPPIDGMTTFTFDAAGNQQVDNAPSGITTNVWDYENMRMAVLLPSGQRETMTYNADLRMVRKDP